MQTDDKGRDRTKVSPFFIFAGKVTCYLQRRLFKEKVSGKKRGGNVFFYNKKLPSWQFLTSVFTGGNTTFPQGGQLVRQNDSMKQ